MPQSHVSRFHTLEWRSNEDQSKKLEWSQRACLFSYSQVIGNIQDKYDGTFIRTKVTREFFVNSSSQREHNTLYVSLL